MKFCVEKTWMLSLVAGTLLLAFFDSSYSAEVESPPSEKIDSMEVSNVVAGIEELPDISGHRPPIRELPLNPWILVLAILGLLVLAVAVLILCWRRYCATVGRRQALKAVDRLEDSSLLEEGALREFYKRLNLILRRYIHRCYDVKIGPRAMRFARLLLKDINLRQDCRLSRTNRELMEMLESRGFDEELRENIGTVLLECDLVKFAGYRPETEASRNALSRVRAFIEACNLSGGREGAS